MADDQKTQRRNRREPDNYDYGVSNEDMNEAMIGRAIVWIFCIGVVALWIADAVTK